MEQNLSNEVAEHEAARKLKLKRKRTRKTIILSALAVVLLAGGFIAYKTLALKKEDDKAGVLRFRLADISEGEINTTISGSGTLSAKKNTNIAAIADGKVTEIYKQAGDVVSDGEPILKINSDSLEEELAGLYSSLQSTQKRLASTTRERNNLNINAPQAGLIKDILVNSGDASDGVSYLCRISTDEKMKTVIDAPNSLKKYDTVSLEINGAVVSGTVEDILDNKAHIVFDDNSYSVGTPVLVSLNELPLGNGVIECNENVVVTAPTGAIDEIKVTENQSIRKNETLFTLKKGTMSDQYKKYYDQEQSYISQIQALEDALTVKSDLNGILASLTVEEGDTVTSGTPLCTLSSTDTYLMTLGIDELDITSVAIGQDATITLDAIEGEFPGKVTNISYSGTGTYITTYTATISFDSIEGAFPGMNGDVEIITKSSGTSMLVPVAAVQYDGPDTYILRVPEGFDMAQEITGTDAFRKVPVTTGMSDGSYIVIQSSECKPGDKICIPGMETTAVYSPDSDNNNLFAQFRMGNNRNRNNGQGFSGERPEGMPNDRQQRGFGG